MSAAIGSDRHLRADYPYGLKIQSRWRDNDMYQHMNNVVYYECFDTLINVFLIEHGQNPSSSACIGLVVESGCVFKASFTYPEMIEVRMRIGKCGNSSLRYELALFKAERDEACATGFVVHVFVDRASQAPMSMPPRVREAAL
ncbi:MAG: hypothetical protein RLZZ502_1891, partial [Pseudomonadota bacterium]